MFARVILADPPWEYNDRRETRRDNAERKPKFGIGVARRYAETMSPLVLSELGPTIQAVSAPDAYLFMWATCPMLSEALQTIEAWGFRYLTVAFVWIKTTQTGECWKGPGHYIPSNAELCLHAIRKGGRPWHDTETTRPAQEIREPHARLWKLNKHGRRYSAIHHSRKPETVQYRIEQWLNPYLDGHSRLELFATRRRTGWICYGGDVTRRDIREDLASAARIASLYGGSLANSSR